MNEQDLFKLKERIDDAKSKVSELEGQRKHLIKELNEQWSCNSVEAAEKKAKEIEDEITFFNQKIDDGCFQLKDMYNI